MIERRGLMIVFTVIIAVEGFIMFTMAAGQQGSGFLASVADGWGQALGTIGTLMR